MSSVTPRYIISRVRSVETPEAQTYSKTQPVIMQNKKGDNVTIGKKNLEKEAYNAGKSDFNNKIKYLLKSGGRYNKYLNTIMGYSNTQMSQAEGLYPEKGQYENVPYSGWQKPPLTSLLQEDALSTSDRIGFGLKDRKRKDDLIGGGMYWDYMCVRLAQEKANEGGNFGPRQKYLNKFVETGIGRFKNFMGVDDLKKRDDPISQLAAIQAEDMIKRLNYLTDDSELKKLTNVDLEEEGLKKMYVTARLFPNVINTNMADGRAEGVTWYMRPTTRMIDVPHGKPETLAIRVKKQTPEGEKSEYITLEGQKPTKKKRIGEGEEIFNGNEASDLWHYAKPYLLASPLNSFVDDKGKSIRPVADLVKPYYTVSPLTQTLLEGYKRQMSELPGADDPKVKKDFFEQDWLFGEGGKPIGKGAAGIPNITEMYGDSSNILAYANPMGLELILKYATATDPQQVDYNDFFKKRFKSQRNFQVDMNPETLRNPFLGRNKAPLFSSSLPPMFGDKMFDPQQDFGLVDQFKKLPGIGAYSLGKFW